LKDKVSIITPSFNSEKFIEETIKSVLSQTYQNWEMIIVDDCSEDNSVGVISRYVKNDERIKMIQSKTNRGPAISRNEALKYASGRFIAFLDSDDLWLPVKLKRQLEFMASTESVLSFTAYGKIDEDGNEGNLINAPKKVNYERLLKTCSIGILTAMYDTEYLGKVYMPDIFSVEDYALWLKITKQGYEAHGLDEKLSLYRVRKQGISRNKIRKSTYQWKVYRELENLSILKSLYYMFFYTYNGYKKFRRLAGSFEI
jgi:glycosyltransferase involved in cell wall biosynthesis